MGNFGIGLAYANIFIGFGSRFICEPKVMTGH